MSTKSAKVHGVSEIHSKNKKIKKKKKSQETINKVTKKNQ
jgi:hypothetical protein